MSMGSLIKKEPILRLRQVFSVGLAATASRLKVLVLIKKVTCCPGIRPCVGSFNKTGRSYPGLEIIQWTVFLDLSEEMEGSKMEETGKNGQRKNWYRMRPIVSAMLVMMLVGAAVALGIVVVGGNIHGNTVNYNAFGLERCSDYHVTLENDENGQSNTYNENSNDKGEISGSGTAGGEPLKPGSSVTITVYDEGDNPVGSTTITTGLEDTPWWAYTGIGTIVWWIY